MILKMLIQAELNPSVMECDDEQIVSFNHADNERIY